MNTNPHLISLEEATLLTHSYQNSVISLGQTISAKFDSSSISMLLSQPNCTGVRIYLGLNVNDEITPVIVGIDANNNDLVNGIILDRGELCPPHCVTSPLMK